MMIKKFICSIVVAGMMLTGACATGTSEVVKVADENEQVCEYAATYLTQVTNETKSSLIEIYPNIGIESNLTTCMVLSKKDLGYASVHVVIYDGGIIQGEFEQAHFLIKENGKWSIINSNMIYSNQYVGNGEQNGGGDNGPKPMEL